MTGTMIGLNMKYLPWQLFVPLVFSFSLECMYYAVVIKGKEKVVNMFFFCIAISLFLLGTEILAKNTGIFAQYLPIMEAIYWILGCITIVLIFFFF